MTQHVTNSAVTFSLPPCDILIVEDEPLVSALVMRYLSSLAKTPYFKALKQQPGDPLKIHCLNSGWDLLHADLSHVKVAVVDILLPQVTGVDLIRDFRKRFPALGIVPISGMATEPMKRNLRDTLPQGFDLLPKPLRKEDFFEAFVRAWNYHQSPPADAFLQQQQSSLPIAASPEEGGREMWTAVQMNPKSQVPVVSVKRDLLRKKAA